ncbi:DUF3560 domain-containing protein [Kineococcus radiotolerans]|uniref:DUF3560 domain-containing protein n=1 Tax=Kineococcus radiotolerans (strain ATCC BAA-149 / DSM 14245 / SRS30216) TaxID=266940 RepID=A6WA83_KINRD|nr:DUF3560 domain-containing protein [Kineococcus radiotolerans]ABS03722.1 hypothetical protein Krad_2241 [Kineococcus radiotolerans SRS30216 = ATCC BAA-149]
MSAPNGTSRPPCGRWGTATPRRAASRTGIPLGQLILVGHHSEGRARRDAARMGAHMDASVAHTDAAEEARRAARIAKAATDARYNPVTVAKRVERLTPRVGAEEKALAHCERAVAAGQAAAAALSAVGGPDSDLDRGQVQPDRPRAGESAQGAAVRYGLNMAAHAAAVAERLQAHRADLAHWQAVRARQVADGTATGVGRHNVAAGDQVRVRGHCYEVVRANAKTVTVLGMFGPRATLWQEVQEHRRGAGGTGDQARAGGVTQPLFTARQPPAASGPGVPAAQSWPCDDPNFFGTSRACASAGP